MWAPDVLVAVHLGRSLDLLVAIFAVPNADGAYLPLDPSNPSQRIRAIVEDARRRVVIGSLATQIFEGTARPCTSAWTRDRDCVEAFPARAPELELAPNHCVRDRRLGLDGAVQGLARHHVQIVGGA